MIAGGVDLVLSFTRYSPVNLYLLFRTGIAKSMDILYSDELTAVWPDPFAAVDFGTGVRPDDKDSRQQHPEMASFACNRSP